METILKAIRQEAGQALGKARGKYSGMTPFQRHALTAILTALGTVTAGQFGTGIPNSPAALGERLAVIETLQREQGKDITLIKNYLINRKGH